MRRDLGRRTLRVPVRCPNSVALLGRTAMAGAAAGLAASVWWQAGAAGLAVLAGTAGGAAMIRRPRRGGASVQAVRAVAGTRRWQVRCAGQWRHATLSGSWRGACWLDLRLRLEAMPGSAVTNCRATVWRAGLSAPRWRRLCLLAGAAQRLAPPAEGAP
ncbi:hypothetical protein BPNSA17_30150 [Bordetella petrii]